MDAEPLVYTEFPSPRHDFLRQTLVTDVSCTHLISNKGWTEQTNSLTDHESGMKDHHEAS